MRSVLNRNNDMYQVSEGQPMLPRWGGPWLGWERVNSRSVYMVPLTQIVEVYTSLESLKCALQRLFELFFDIRLNKKVVTKKPNKNNFLTSKFDQLL